MQGELELHTNYGFCTISDGGSLFFSTDDGLVPDVSGSGRTITVVAGMGCATDAVTVDVISLLYHGDKASVNKREETAVVKSSEDKMC